MSPRDLVAFSVRGLTGHGLRTALSLLGVMIGVAAVVVLTALGEGARRYVVGQFESLGTNLLIVLPGKTETSGTAGIGGVPNDLTLEDTQAITRRLRLAEHVAPVAMGTEEISYSGRRRQVAVLGTTPAYREARQVEMARGEFLPAAEIFRGAPVVVLGAKSARELFGGEEPLGKVIRVGDWRMRVIGVMARQGKKLGIDFDDIAIVPVSTAMQLLDRRSLFRILIQVRPNVDLDLARERVLGLIVERHEEEDVTVITQDAVVTTFEAILDALTLAVAAIAAVSLSVAGVGIMNVMLVAVSERTSEIGLLKALGVGRGQIMAVFLAESAFLSAAGGLAGLAVGWLVVQAMVGLYPALPATTPPWAILAALGTALGVGIVFGLLPARNAVKLDPVTALGRK